MTRVAWEEAVRRLLDDVYTFAATGPRTRAGWQRDALAVMRRDAEDPRGWITLDWDRSNDARRAGSPLWYPFVPLSAEGLERRLYPVTSGTAVRLLVEMTYEWGPAGTEERTRAAFADARSVLHRYGDRVSCYSNVSAARESPSPDLTKGVTGWYSLTEFIGDFGFVVVSSEEVGVYWSFDASEAPKCRVTTRKGRPAPPAPVEDAARRVRPDRGGPGARTGAAVTVGAV